MGDRSRIRTSAVCPSAWIVLGLLLLAGCNPMAAWTNNQSGKAFYRAGRYAEAREEFRRAVADSPRNPDYIHNYATASRRAGDPIAAEQGYRQALALNPGHQPSYHGLAVTLKDTGRTAEAHSLLSNWVATQPYSEKPYIEMAWLQKEMGDVTGAERSLVQALQIRPNHPLAMANLGQIYEQTGRSQLAMSAYQRSLSADWNQPQVAGRISRLRQSGTTTIAAAPMMPIVATVPGPMVATAPGMPMTASTPGMPMTASATGGTPNPVPAYRQTSDASLAADPFRPTPRSGLAPQPFTPNQNLPLARNPFQPTSNVPLASQPFPMNQAFLNVPAAPLPQAVPQTATPFGRQPR